MDKIKSFETLLARGQDSALLRYTLGNEYLKQGDLDKALEHLCSAVTQDPQYSAAWKVYGKALASAKRIQAAMEAYESGIKVAEEKGDIQAAKEMKVFLKRLQKTAR
jgi:Tfp pilus assembly protein PilF